MNKLINAKIDVKKINKDLLFKGGKGTYLDLTIWINDKPDQFGNDISIEQRTAKGEAKIYLGNGKFYQKSEPRVETRESIMNAPDDFGPQIDDGSDMPF